MFRVSMFAIVLCLMFGLGTPHICMIHPPQRGPMDISMPGSQTCTRHEAPCGGQTEPSKLTNYMAGSQIFLKWQQNLNHYTVGFPGYMDVAIGTSVNDTDWYTLAFFPDKYLHVQSHQQNYTAVANLPSDMECKHCILRARYQSHKPGETTFYQCSDVSVTRQRKPYRLALPPPPPNEPEYKSMHSIMNLNKASPISPNVEDYMIQGFAYNDFDRTTVHFVNVSLASGNVHPLNTFQFGLSESSDQKESKELQMMETEDFFLNDAIAALNPGQGEMLTVYHKGGSRETVSAQVTVFFTINGTIETSLELKDFNNVPINGFRYVKPRTYVTFGLQEINSMPGTFSFVLGKITYVPGTGLVYQELYRTPDSGSENLYVNFQWAEYNPVNGMLYVLMGNENSLDKLNARIYTFDFNNPRLVSKVEVDVSRFTFSSFQFHHSTGKLFAVAPQVPFSDKKPAWSLVEVSPLTGSVAEVTPLMEQGYFERYYGGSIFNGLEQDSGVLYHVMRVADTVADVILSVDVTRHTTHFSQLCNLRHVHSLALSPNF